MEGEISEDNNIVKKVKYETVWKGSGTQVTRTIESSEGNRVHEGDRGGAGDEEKDGATI